jgi:hypothetical protein
MSSSMIWTQVQAVEEVMELDPPFINLMTDDLLIDAEFQDVDEGGAMMEEDSEDERDQENVPPPVIQVDTPYPAPVVWSLIPIENPAPVTPAVKVTAEGEDDAWYITGDKTPCIEPVHA